MSQGVGKPQHMGGRLGEPFPLPALKRALLLVRKLRKLRCSLGVEAEGVIILRILTLAKFTQEQKKRDDVDAFYR